jgi:hypothetical protein
VALHDVTATQAEWRSPDIDPTPANASVAILAVGQKAAAIFSNLLLLTSSSSPEKETSPQQQRQQRPL